jgi:hypothetical protein
MRREMGPQMMRMQMHSKLMKKHSIWRRSLVWVCPRRMVQVLLKWIQSFKQDFMYVSEAGETCFRDCLNRDSVKAIWDRMSHWITRTDILTVHKKIKQLQIDMRIAFKKPKTSS